MKWYYPVHEMLGTIHEKPISTSELPLPKISLVLHHRPKRDEHTREEMYFELLKIREEEDTDSIDSVALAMLGDQYKARGELEKAIKYYKKSSEIPKGKYEAQNFQE